MKSWYFSYRQKLILLNFLFFKLRENTQIDITTKMNLKEIHIYRYGVFLSVWRVCVCFFFLFFVFFFCFFFAEKRHWNGIRSQNKTRMFYLFFFLNQLNFKQPAGARVDISLNERLSQNICISRKADLMARK